MNAAELLREVRAAAGLTQQQVARLAATSQSAIAAYESGSREPALRVLDRLVKACGYQLKVSAEHDPALLRLEDVARAIRDIDDDPTRLRLVYEFLRHADEDGQPLPLLVAREPGATGNARFDALLAAVAEDLCVSAQLPAPAWVLEPARFLDGFWWVADLPSARAQALVHAPASYRRRGVMLARHDLQVA